MKTQIKGSDRDEWGADKRVAATEQHTTLWWTSKILHSGLYLSFFLLVTAYVPAPPQSTCMRCCSHEAEEDSIRL